MGGFDQGFARSRPSYTSFLVGVLSFQERTEMARKKLAALLVDVLVDAGVERAYSIWSFEFRELPAFCGMVGKLIISLAYSASA